MHSLKLTWNDRHQKIVTTNKIKLKLKTILPVKHFRNNARTKRSGRTWEQSAGPPDPNNANKTTTGPGHKRTAGEEDRAKAPGRNQPNSPTTAQATCAANSHLGKPKHLVERATLDCFLLCQNNGNEWPSPVTSTHNPDVLLTLWTQPAKSASV